MAKSLSRTPDIALPINQGQHDLLATKTWFVSSNMASTLNFPQPILADEELNALIYSRGSISKSILYFYKLQVINQWRLVRTRLTCMDF